MKKIKMRKMIVELMAQNAELQGELIAEKEILIRRDKEIEELKCQLYDKGCNCHD